MIRTSLFALALGVAAPAFAQAPTPPAAPPAPPAPLAIPAPTYTSLVLEIAVNASAADAWARIGRFCDAGEWFNSKCVITSGVEGELGSVRTINGVTIEPLVAKTALSYTYTQPVRVGVPFNAYHATLEARPVTAKTSKLVYSFVYDNSMLADDAARATEKTNRTTRFMGGLTKMKQIVESKAPRP